MPRSANRSASDTTPYWNSGATIPRFPSLTQSLACDVVVIGAGITGITAAYLLQRDGRRVVLIERDRCANVDTGHTSAHLSCVTDTPLTEKVIGEVALTT